MKLTEAMRKNIYKLLQSENLSSLDFSTIEGTSIPSFIYDDYKSQKESPESIRPLRILISLWSFKWRTNSKFKLRSHEKQEALLYSLIIISWIVLFVLSYKTTVTFFWVNFICT